MLLLLISMSSTALCTLRDYESSVRDRLGSMANPTTNIEAAEGSVQVATGTTLSGRIEAISVEDLLRVSMTKRSTGRLVVFNDQFDAELYYVQGRLVAIVSGNRSGKELLKPILEMVAGEFEFASGIEVARAQYDATAHDALNQALRAKVQESAPLPQEPPREVSAPIKTSGVHRVPTESRYVPPPPAALTPALTARLADIEILLIQELGQSGKTQLQRALSKTPRGVRPVSEWLLALRTSVLATVTDPGARATIATSYYWTPPE